MRCFGFLIKYTVGRRTGTQQQWTNTYKIPCGKTTKSNLLENPKANPMQYIMPIIKSPERLMIFLLYLEWLNRTDGPRVAFFCDIKIFPCFPGHRGRLFFWHNRNNSLVAFLFIWMILGVLWNVVIWKVCSWLLVGFVKIFDFGILWIICFEISFLMIISRDPINVIDMHMVKRILSFLKWLRIKIP